MANLIKTKRGLNIPITGSPVEMIGKSTLPKDFALVPDYFHGVTPKLLVKEVIPKAGTPVFMISSFRI